MSESTWASWLGQHAAGAFFSASPSHVSSIAGTEQRTPQNEHEVFACPQGGVPRARDSYLRALLWLGGHFNVCGGEPRGGLVFLLFGNI